MNTNPYWSLIVGDFRIAPATDPTKIRIEKDDGEGGEFESKDFYHAIERFYDENH